jgi:hypothetical protein
LLPPEGGDSVRRMNGARTLRFYLEPTLRESAAAGRHNFINLVAGVCERAGMGVAYHDIAARQDHPGGPSMTHMKPPPGADGLVFRRVYEYPFWQIERVAERWRWETAHDTFDPGTVEGAEAARFYRFWQKRLYPGATEKASRDGYVYIPLQGKLLQRRSFQSCTPLEMVTHCLARDPARRIVATLHPKESYEDRELAALERLEQSHPRLTLSSGEMVRHLQRCDYVVTQNSGAGFAGYFFGKPLLMFGEADFHHIAVRADMGDLTASFRQVGTHAPDYARYLWWFWQERSINAGRPEAAKRIATRLRHLGWPV